MAVCLKRSQGYETTEDPHNVEIQQQKGQALFPILMEFMYNFLLFPVLNCLQQCCYIQNVQNRLTSTEHKAYSNETQLGIVWAQSQGAQNSMGLQK